MGVLSKFRNSTASEKRVGCFGMGDAANMRSTLSGGEISQDNLFEGWRVVVVWDAFSDLVVFTDTFKVDTSANGGVNRFDIAEAGGVVTVNGSSAYYAPGAPGF